MSCLSGRYLGKPKLGSEHSSPSKRVGKKCYGRKSTFYGEAERQEKVLLCFGVSLVSHGILWSRLRTIQKCVLPLFVTLCTHYCYSVGVHLRRRRERCVLDYGTNQRCDLEYVPLMLVRTSQGQELTSSGHITKLMDTLLTVRHSTNAKLYSNQAARMTPTLNLCGKKCFPRGHCNSCRVCLFFLPND